MPAKPPNTNVVTIIGTAKTITTTGSAASTTITPFMPSGCVHLLPTGVARIPRT